MYVLAVHAASGCCIVILSVPFLQNHSCSIPELSVSVWLSCTSWSVNHQSCSLSTRGLPWSLDFCTILVAHCPYGWVMNTSCEYLRTVVSHRLCAHIPPLFTFTEPVCIIPRWGTGDVEASQEISPDWQALLSTVPSATAGMCIGRQHDPPCSHSQTQKWACFPQHQHHPRF